jgi:hypothetical protein
VEGRKRVCGECRRRVERSGAGCGEDEKGEDVQMQRDGGGVRRERMKKGERGDLFLLGCVCTVEKGDFFFSLPLQHPWESYAYSTHDGYIYLA